MRIVVSSILASDFPALSVWHVDCSGACVDAFLTAIGLQL